MRIVDMITEDKSCFINKFPPTTSIKNAQGQQIMRIKILMSGFKGLTSDVQANSYIHHCQEEGW